MKNPEKLHGNIVFTQDE